MTTSVSSVFSAVLDPVNRHDPYPLYTSLRRTPVGVEADGTYCYGAPLARLEAQLALQALVPALSDARLLEDPPQYRISAVLRGPRHLRVDRHRDQAQHRQ
ncbi:hypothetical protein ABT297_32470 [Dactylosporangium sp. NPDC000555]|uniref:hypothetical protein n=1 Tax=Dactylosporangium sp. NPDC000555 TaxID=3154260 RepID=UPI00331F9D22